MSDLFCMKHLPMRAAFKHVLRAFMPGLVLVLGPVFVAAPHAAQTQQQPPNTAPAAPQVQAELDTAVIDYGAGRHQRARLAFESLSRRGLAAADYNLAVMHLKRELPRPSVQRARALLDRAARNGFVTAQLMLARVLESGELGARDLPLAHCWYEAAAESGSVEAQLAMGTGHFLGRGLAKDATRAAHWFREAAKGGDIGAMYLLASMYEQGDGVERDLRLARYWYGIAAQGGDEAAPAKVKELDAKLAAPPT